MKVNFKNLISGYTGKADDIIIVYDRQTNRYYVRSRPQRDLGPENTAFGDKMVNMGKLEPSQPYKDDMQLYLELYNALPFNKYNPVKAWCNLFMKIMFTMERSLPGVNLATITRQQIYDQSLPCLSVKTAVEAGLLPAVKNYERFSNPI